MTPMRSTRSRKGLDGPPNDAATARRALLQPCAPCPLRPAVSGRAVRSPCSPAPPPNGGGSTCSWPAHICSCCRRDPHRRRPSAAQPVCRTIRSLSQWSSLHSVWGYKARSLNSFSLRSFRL